MQPQPKTPNTPHDIDAKRARLIAHLQAQGYRRPAAHIDAAGNLWPCYIDAQRTRKGGRYAA